MARLLHLWGQKIRQHPSITTGVIVVLFALIVLSFAVYKFGWDWTGFSGGESKITITSTAKGTTIAKELQPARTLWDWLGLLAVLAIPVVVGFGAAWFTVQQGKVSDRENTDNQRETALQAYIDNMSELLLHENLRGSAEDAEVRKIARVRTLTVLPRLDKVRKRSVLLFLHESELIDKDKPIVNLNGADLSNAKLSRADWDHTNLRRANLRKANLWGAYLDDADLSHADLQGAKLNPTTLMGTTLKNAQLQKADLSGSLLRGADLSFANLYEANLYDADLSEADLTGIQGITVEELEKKARSLKGATMRDGSKHP